MTLLLKTLALSIKIGVIKRYGVWSVSKLSTESVGSRRELVANCVQIADADATKQFRRVVLYWVLRKLSWTPSCINSSDDFVNDSENENLRQRKLNVYLYCNDN